MSDEQLTGLMIGLGIIVAERDNKTFLRLWVCLMLIFAVVKYGI